MFGFFNNFHSYIIYGKRGKKSFIIHLLPTLRPLIQSTLKEKLVSIFCFTSQGGICLEIIQLNVRYRKREKHITRVPKFKSSVKVFWFTFQSWFKNQLSNICKANGQSNVLLLGRKQARLWKKTAETSPAIFVNNII